MSTEELIINTIPIYTRKKPHPITGKEDCELTRNFKKTRRIMMRARLEEAGDDQEKINAIIKRYARTEQ